MPLSVRCEHCFHILNVPDKAAGKRVQCSRCKTIFVVPDAPEVGEEEEFRLAPLADEKSQPEPLAPKSVPVTPQSAPKITFPCTSCGHILKAPISAIGKKVKCSLCKTVQMISTEPIEAPKPSNLQTSPEELPVLDLGLFVPKTPKPELDTGLFAPVVPKPELDTGLFAPPEQTKSVEELLAMDQSSDPFADIPIASPIPSAMPVPPRTRRSSSRYAPVGDVFAGTFRILGRHFGDFFLMGLKFFFCSFGVGFGLMVIMMLSIFAAAFVGAKSEPAFMVTMSLGAFGTGIIALFYVTACMLGGNNVAFRLTAGKSAGPLFGFETDHYWKAVGCNLLIAFCALAITVPIHFATFKSLSEADFQMARGIVFLYQEDDFGTWTFGQTNEQPDDTDEDSRRRTVPPPRRERPSVPTPFAPTEKFFEDEKEKEPEKAEVPSDSIGRGQNMPNFPAPPFPKPRFLPPQQVVPEIPNNKNALPQMPQEERQQLGKFVEPRNIPFQQERQLSDEDKARMIGFRCGERIGAFTTMFNLINFVLIGLMFFVYTHAIDRNLSVIDTIIQSFTFFWCNFGSVFLGGLIFYVLPVGSVVAVMLLLTPVNPVLGGLCAFFGVIFICLMIVPCCCCFAVVTYRTATYGEVK